nr:mucin-1 [Paramormyrops kingsleyae]
MVQPLLWRTILCFVIYASLGACQVNNTFESNFTQSTTNFPTIHPSNSFTDNTTISTSSHSTERYTESSTYSSIHSITDSPTSHTPDGSIHNITDSPTSHTPDGSIHNITDSPTSHPSNSSTDNTTDSQISHAPDSSANNITTSSTSHPTDRSISNTTYSTINHSTDNSADNTTEINTSADNSTNNTTHSPQHFTTTSSSKTTVVSPVSIAPTEVDNTTHPPTHNTTKPIEVLPTVPSSAHTTQQPGQSITSKQVNTIISTQNDTSPHINLGSTSYPSSKITPHIVPGTSNSSGRPDGEPTGTQGPENTLETHAGNHGVTNINSTSSTSAANSGGVPGWAIALLVLVCIAVLLLFIVIILLLVICCYRWKHYGYLDVSGDPIPYSHINHGTDIPMHSTHSHYEAPNGKPNDNPEAPRRNRTGTYVMHK